MWADAVVTPPVPTSAATFSLNEISISVAVRPRKPSPASMRTFDRIGMVVRRSTTFWTWPSDFMSTARSHRQFHLCKDLYVCAAGAAATRFQRCWKGGREGSFNAYRASGLVYQRMPEISTRFGASTTRRLTRISHHGQARHRVGRRRSARRRPPSVAWATRKAFDAAGGPPGATRRAADIGRQDRVKALARLPARSRSFASAKAGCASTHLHDATVRRTALRGRPARRSARRDAGRITSAGQRRRRPRKAALRVAFPVPSGRRERSAMPRRRRHAPDCRGTGKRDPTCRGIVQGSTGIAPRAVPSLSADIRRAAPVLGEKAGLDRFSSRSCA